MAGTSRCSPRQTAAFIAFFLSLLTSGSATAQVPLLMWSSDGLPPLALPTAGHITSIDQLTAYLTSAFSTGPHTVLLFLQDKLSKEDFTVFGGAFGNKEESAFKNLEAALQSSSSSVTLPALEWSGSSAVLALLQEKLGASPLLVDVDTLSHLSINASASNLLLINLPYCTGLQKSCKETLQDNDGIIGKVQSVMKDKDVRYTAVYTGLQPSRVISEMLVMEQPAGRSLLQAPTPAPVKPPIIFNNGSAPCIMLWAEKLSVSSPDTTNWIDLATENVSTAGSQCNGTNSLLVLSFPQGATLRFAMSQRFYPVSARNWFTLDSVQLEGNGTSTTFIANRSIYAPAEYSYHCQSVSSFQDALLIPNTEGSNWRVNFVDFQIQGFGLSNGTNFSYASDCAGFFTIGIWMGLLTSLLMVLILVYGLHMIMQVNTMDRFDDPKGPSISVPQSE
ncbi:unnamed protein product [Ophioblennius macclurei]